MMHKNGSCYSEELAVRMDYCELVDCIKVLIVLVIELINCVLETCNLFGI